MAATGLVAAQTASDTGLSPEVLLIARIRVHMEATLLRLPNYTCVETIQRSQRRAPARRYQMVDTLRLEVALVDGAEMFSWPGEQEFGATDPREIVPTGAIGTGAFGSHARSVFLSHAPQYTYQGQENVEGRLYEKFDYSVPLNLSGYRLKMDEMEAVVAHYGSFWVSAETLDLGRLIVHADMIPPELKLSAVETSMEYRRAPIGNRDFLLPSRAITILTHANGDESRNEITFSDCRQYTGESFLSFEPPPENIAAPQPSLPEVSRLPAGLELDLTLQTPIEAGQSAVGDAIRAVTRRAVRSDGSVLVPKGSEAVGRLLHFERYPARRPYFVVAIRFDSVEFDGRRVEFDANLERIHGYAGPGRPLTPASELRLHFPRQEMVRLPDLEATPGAGVLYVNGETLRIPPGWRMVWRTVSGR